jgi:uncharacterized protein YggE
MKFARSLCSLIFVGSCWVPLISELLITTSPAVAQVRTQVQPPLQQEHAMRTLTVTGSGKASIATTRARVQLGVEAQGKTAVEVQQEVAERSTRVVEFLRSRNVDKLQTTGISLNPQYDYSNNRQQIIGYTASNTVSFEIPTEQTGSLLDQAVQAGASRIDSVSFIAADDAIAVARQQAIREAIQDAQAQAQVALDALGFSPQEIIGIQINGAAMPRPIPFNANQAFARSAAVEDSATTPVVGGEQEVQASVTLQIRY